MAFLETEQGKKNFEQYLKKFKGKSSWKIYRSEIRQFFDFYSGELPNLNRSVFLRYRNNLSQNARAKTIKRKFSILNQFFKFLEKKIKDFKSPIGKNHGDMQAFQSKNYADSEAFKTQLNHWTEILICESTRKTYRSHLKLFLQWVEKDPKDLNQEDFIKYRDHLIKERRLKETTVWIKFIAINGYLKFLASKNRKFKNPLDFKNLSLVPAKKDKGYYSVLTEKEVRRTLRQPDRRTLIGKRDYAMLRLMLTYGLRAGEICRLVFRDVESERVKGQQKIWIRDRKGRIGRRADTDIILNGKVLEAFDDWMDNSGIRFDSDTPIFAGFIWNAETGGLIINYRRLRAKKHLTVNTIENIVSKYVKKARLDQGERVISPHALRHTALTLLARAGIELVDLKWLAGHQDVSTTMIYLHSVQSYEDHVGMHNPINK